MTATRRRSDCREAQFRRAAMVWFSAFALDHATARRGAPDALTDDPILITEWGSQLKVAWLEMSPNLRAGIRRCLEQYGEASTDPAEAKQDAVAALKFLDEE